MPVVPILTLALAAGSSGAEAERLLIERARVAKAQNDAAAVADALQGWATIAEGTALPAGLEAEAQAAIAWAAEEGRFVVFGARLSDRVRVGVHDPARLLGRLEASVVSGGDRITLARSEDVADRFEYRLSEALSSDADVVIDAVMTRFGGDVLLRRITLGPIPTAVLPPPDPKRLAQRMLPAAEAREPAAKEGPALAWWWIAGGIAAAALCGAAFWQETRR